MNIQIQTPNFNINEKLATILAEKLKEKEAENKAVILNFRDKSYSAENGGFHPVEISIGADGTVHYITDFAYVGHDEQSELAIDIDWNFTSSKFQTLYSYDPIEVGLNLFNLWQSNFIYYYDIGCYDEIEITV